MGHHEDFTCQTKVLDMLDSTRIGHQQIGYIAVGNSDISHMTICYQFVIRCFMVFIIMFISRDQ